jgi:hypothetical protein
MSRVPVGARSIELMIELRPKWMGITLGVQQESGVYLTSPDCLTTSVDIGIALARFITLVEKFARMGWNISRFF